MGSAFIGGNRAVHVAKLKEARKKAKFSQEYMAKKVGVSRRHYQRLEKGDMPAWMVEDICEMLGLKVLILEKEILK